MSGDDGRRQVGCRIEDNDQSGQLPDVKPAATGRGYDGSIEKKDGSYPWDVARRRSWDGA